MEATQMLLAEQICAFLPETQDVSIFFLTEESAVNAWVQNHIIDPDVKILGIDTEWLPNRRGQDNPVALIQVATLTSVLLFHVFHASVKKPEKLTAVLADPYYQKVSVEILHDSLLLQRHWDILVHGRLDLGVIDQEDILGHKAGLANLTEKYLGHKMPKPKDIQKGNWQEEELSEEQLRYAALDAWICIPIYLAMLELGLEMEVDSDPPKVAREKMKHMNRCEKRKRRLQLLKSKLTCKSVSIPIFEHIQDNLHWQEFRRSYVTPPAFKMQQFAKYLEEEDGLLSIWGEDTRFARKKLERLIRNLIDLQLLERKYGVGQLKFSTKIHRRKDFTLSINDQTVSNSVSRNFGKGKRPKTFNEKIINHNPQDPLALHRKLHLAGLWCEKYERQPANQQVEEEKVADKPEAREAEKRQASFCCIL